MITQSNNKVMFTNRSTGKQTDRPLQEEHAESPVTPGIAAPPTIKSGHLSKLSSFKHRVEREIKILAILTVTVCND